MDGSIQGDQGTCGHQFHNLVIQLIDFLLFSFVERRVCILVFLIV